MCGWGEGGNGVLGTLKRWARSRAKALTPKKKKKRKKHELLKPPSFSVCEILHFGTHFQAKVKKTKQNVELALPKDFAILIILPKRQAPEGQSVPQASSAPPFSTLQLACNGLVVPPPPTESPGRAKLR